MKYEHIRRAVADEVWAIDPMKGWAIVEFLAFASAGGTYNAAELEARIGAADTKAIRERSGSVAVVPLHGVMSQRISGLKAMSGGTSTEAVGRSIDKAIGDDSVKAILLHVDSPGGAIHGTRELAAKIAAARDVKPIVAQVDSLAASAAYWVATQASEVVVTPGGEVGSIGVYTVHEEISGLQAAAGIKSTIVHAGKFKVEGNPFEELDGEARSHLQDRVDEAFRDFISAVARGRGVSARTVEQRFGEGRSVTAKQALAAGMVDRVATFDETLARFSRRTTMQRRATSARALARS